MDALDPKAVETRADLVRFVRTLSEQDDERWENLTTAAYLEALAAWVEDWPEDLQATWSDFAQVLLAATVYE